MDRLTLKQLRYFEAVAQQGHFGRAAEVCSISQPAISVQIKELEETLGGVLFDRSARYVYLTPFGVSILERAREILRKVDDIGSLARASQEKLVGKLRLGIIPTVAPYYLPQVMKKFAADAPDLELSIRESLSETLISEITGGKLDAAIMALPTSEPSLTETPLFDEAFVLVRPLTDQEKPIPDQAGLRAMRLLLLEEGHCFRDQALSFCGYRSLFLRSCMEGSSLTTLVQMVGAGLGVTLIPEMAIPIETGSARVDIARFSDPAPRRSIGIVTRSVSDLGERLLGVLG